MAWELEEGGVQFHGDLLGVALAFDLGEGVSQGSTRQPVAGSRLGGTRAD